MVMADREEELETFDNLNDLFANWDSLKDEDKDNTRKSSKPLDEETKREILSRLLEESQGIICTETNATDSQDFLYGKDGMPS